jgi:hypothetical protein
MSGLRPDTLALGTIDFALGDQGCRSEPARHRCTGALALSREPGSYGATRSMGAMYSATTVAKVTSQQTTGVAIAPPTSSSGRQRRRPWSQSTTVRVGPDIQRRPQYRARERRTSRRRSQPQLHQCPSGRTESAITSTPLTGLSLKRRCRISRLGNCEVVPWPLRLVNFELGHTDLRAEEARHSDGDEARTSSDRRSDLVPGLATIRRPVEVCRAERASDLHPPSY